MSTSVSRIELLSPRLWARRLNIGGPATLGLIFIALLIVLSLFGDQLAPYDPYQQDPPNRLAAPSLAHLMGTDEYGRDVLSRVIVGSRVSLSVAFSAVTITVALGCGVGLLSGYVRQTDGVLMRIVDGLLAIPPFLLVLLLVGLFGVGFGQTILFIAISQWMPMARLVRGEVLSLREREFVLAAEGLGSSRTAVMRRHLFPNVAEVVLVQATLLISLVILMESALSYLGLGAQPPIATWGNMLSSGRNFLRQAWWIATFPGLAIFLTVMSFNFVGDGLRDAIARDSGR